MVCKEAVDEDKIRTDITAEETISNSRIRTKVVRINENSQINSSRASRLRQMADSKVGMQLKVGKMVKVEMMESSRTGPEMPSAASAGNLKTHRPPVTTAGNAAGPAIGPGSAGREDPPDWNRNRGTQAQPNAE